MLICLPSAYIYYRSTKHFVLRIYYFFLAGEFELYPITKFKVQPSETKLLLFSYHQYLFWVDGIFFFFIWAI